MKIELNDKSVALAGIGLLSIGVFCPIVSVPFLGNQNYFQNGEGDGCIVLGLAAISLILLLTNRRKFLLISGLLSFLVTAFTASALLYRLHSLKSSMESDLKDNPFAGFAELALRSVQIQWGWLPLFAGSAILVWLGFRSRHESGPSISPRFGEETPESAPPSAS